MFIRGFESPLSFRLGGFIWHWPLKRLDGGRTRPSNLCLACFADNHHKGPCIAGRDKLTKKLVPLFNPRRHKWHRHFRWDGPVLVGLTAIGRVTVAVLEINLDRRVAFRQGLIEEGAFPPR